MGDRGRRGIPDRARHAVAQASAGSHRVTRSMLSYAWSGTGREGRGFFASPWTGSIAKLRILREPGAPRGQWMEERVDLGADWRAA